VVGDEPPPRAAVFQHVDEALVGTLVWKRDAQLAASMESQHLIISERRSDVRSALTAIAIT